MSQISVINLGNDVWLNNVLESDQHKKFLPWILLINRLTPHQFTLLS